MLYAVLAAAASGCLENALERAGYSPELRPRGARIESVEDDVVLRQRIGSNDGVDARVPLRTGFAGGNEVRYWDFGEASGSAEPVWLFRRRGADGTTEAVAHLDLIDSVPGDSNYSPYRVLFEVFVTDAYDGERITSLQALEDAIELGLVEEPVPLEVAMNWPVVLAETELELGDGGVLTPTPVYYRGRVATLLRLGIEHGVSAVPLERGSVGSSNAYVLRRQHEANALDEALWGEDLNGDGDMQDSQVVFAVDAGEEGYTTLWQPIEVTVARAYAFGASTAEADLFESQEYGLAAVNEAIVSFEAADEEWNRPIVHAP